jgi:hypothetical protein
MPEATLIFDSTARNAGLAGDTVVEANALLAWGRVGIAYNGASRGQLTGQVDLLGDTQELLAFGTTFAEPPPGPDAHTANAARGRSLIQVPGRLCRRADDRHS